MLITTDQCCNSDIAIRLLAVEGMRLQYFLQYENHAIVAQLYIERLECLIQGQTDEMYKCAPHGYYCFDWSFPQTPPSLHTLSQTACVWCHKMKTTPGALRQCSDHTWYWLVRPNYTHRCIWHLQVV